MLNSFSKDSTCWSVDHRARVSISILKSTAVSVAAVHFV
jgi:hypothetical protein